MEKQAFEPTGLIPRSIIRTVDRFVQQLLPGREKIALQEYRVSRYQILVSIKSLLTLVLIPILVSSTMKALLFTPLVEHFWNNNQSEIFLNQYQEKRAFSEMHDFSEKMFFESLLIEPKIKSNPLEIENLDTRNILNPPYSTVFYANELGTKHSKNQSINPFCSLYVARTKAHSLHQHVLCKLPRCVAPPYKAPLCTHHFWSPVQSSALQGDALCKAPLCKAHSLQSGALHGMRLRIAPSYKAELCMQSKAKHFFLQSEALYAKQRKERGEVCKERIFARQMPTGQERKSSDLKRFDIPICNSIFSNTFLESETLSGQVLQTKSKKPIAYKALLCKPFKKGLQSRALYRSVNDAVHLPTFVAYKAELCTYKQSDRSLANDAPLNLQFPKTINISSDLQYSSTLLQRSFDSRFSHVRAFATSTELFQGLQSGALYAKRSFPFAPTKLDAFPHPRLYKPIRFASANFVSCCKGTYNKAPLCEVHVLCKPCHVATPVTLQGGTVCIGELCNGFTNPKGHQGFVLSTLLPLRDAPNHVRGLQSGALYVQRKERGCRALSLRPKRSFGKPLQTVNLQRTWLANPKGEQSFATGCISKQTGFVPILYDNNNKLLSYSHFTENDKYETLFQRKSLELAKSYNKQSILAITNLLGDFLTFFTVSVLFRIMRPELIILKSFLTESVYSLSDTTKSFLLILGMDLLVGFHSPRGWELLLEGFLRHIGLPENENFILLFVALFPVFLDTVFKYWIFRYLNKISPSTVVTYHSMIE